MKYQVCQTALCPRLTIYRYSDHLAALNISADTLYTALLADAELQPPDWDVQGRQVNIWKQLGYIPSDVTEPSGTNTKQVSRTLEVSTSRLDVRGMLVFT